MQKKNLIVFDIDDTLTKSENQHQTAYVNTMINFGITEINQDWKSYKNMTDSYILKQNYEANFNKEFTLDFIPSFEEKMTDLILKLPKNEEIKGASAIVNFFMKETDYAICFATGSLLKPALIKLEHANIATLVHELDRRVDENQHLSVGRGEHKTDVTSIHRRINDMEKNKADKIKSIRTHTSREKNDI